MVNISLKNRSQLVIYVKTVQATVLYVRTKIYVQNALRNIYIKISARQAVLIAIIKTILLNNACNASLNVYYVRTKIYALNVKAVIF